MLNEVENIDKEFLHLTDLVDMEPDFFTNAMEKFDLVSFDAFYFEQILTDNCLQYMFYKIC